MHQNHVLSIWYQFVFTQQVIKQNINWKLSNFLHWQSNQLNYVILDGTVLVFTHKVKYHNTLYRSDLVNVETEQPYSGTKIVF